MPCAPEAPVLAHERPHAGPRADQIGQAGSKQTAGARPRSAVSALRLRRPRLEVPAALRRLLDHGFWLFTLTDDTLEISGRQHQNAGIIDLFERRFSVDETVHRHKPAPEAYHLVAGELGVDPGDVCLIACHVWYTIGALAAGWQAGLILREGNAPLDVGPEPSYVGDDLDVLADQLTARYPAEATTGGAGTH
jgi:FMN phosphatase YigB (HAD superfamily)